MRQINKTNKFKKPISIIVVIIILLVVINLTFLKDTKALDSLKNGLFTFSSKVSEPLNNLKTGHDAKEKESEAKILELETELKKYEEQAKEYQELQELLELQTVYQDYQAVYATVISYNKDYWYQEAIIDKGENFGIQEGDAVITSNGLVGRISKVYQDSAIIKLVTYVTNNQITAKVTTSNGERQGLITQSKDGYLIMSGINANEKIEKGSIVTTTGLGSVPKNITIGEVVDTTLDNYQASLQISILPNQDIYNLSYVVVLGSK